MNSAILIGILVFISTTTFAQVNNDLPNFHQVVENRIYRGAQPTNKGFQELAAQNIHTILDLRNEKSLIKQESLYVGSLGLNFISVPLSGFWAPSDKNMNLIENYLNNKDLFPLFIHCQYGEDRTGVAIGLYRVFTQRWKAQDAYNEMIEIGFHPELLFLKGYFDKKTGLSFF